MRFKLNFYIIFLIGLVIAVSTEKQSNRNRRRNLLKGRSANDEILKDNPDSQSDHLIAFVPDSNGNGNIYLVPRYAIENFQNEYTSKIGVEDDSILLSNQELASGNNPKFYGEKTNVNGNFVDEQNNEIDENTDLDYNDANLNSYYVGRQAIRRNRRGGTVVRRRYKNRGGAKRGRGGVRRRPGHVIRRRYKIRGGGRRRRGGVRRRPGHVIRRRYKRKRANRNGNRRNRNPVIYTAGNRRRNVWLQG